MWTRCNQNSLTHRYGVASASRETTQQRRAPQRLIEQLIIRWFKIHLHSFTVFVVVALGWEKVTYRNFEKSNSEGNFVSHRD